MTRLYGLTLMCLLTIGLSRPAFASDGVIEINDVRARTGSVTLADLPGYPVTISQPGSYGLTGNLFVSVNNIDVVVITADNVTLDLNGFTIGCLYFITPCAGNGTGTGIQSEDANNVTVRNGTVRDMASHGVYADGENSRVYDVRALGNGGYGIRVGSHGTVKDSLARMNGTIGIYGAGSGSVISGNTSSDNGGNGISTDADALIQRNNVRGNAGYGLTFNPGTAYLENVINDNGSGTVLSFGVNMGGNSCNGTATCP